MKKISLVSSMLCCALVFGCGDDGKQTSMTNPTTNNTTKTTSDETQGMSSSDTNTTGDATSTNPTTTMSSNSGTTTTAETGDTGMGSGGSFIIEKDGGGMKECDVWMQDCPDGEKCMPYSGDGDSSWESLKCTPAGDKDVGSECKVEGSGVSGIDDCVEGAMCWSVDPETGMGICVQQCTGTPEMPKCDDPETNCLIANDGVLTICLGMCDPLLQNCVKDTDVCVPNPMDPNSFICVIDASGEMGKAFDPCEYANACDAGFICANSELASECDPGSAGCCLPFCDTTVNPPNCPGAGQVCIPWYEMGQAPPGFENVGICGLQM